MDILTILTIVWIHTIADFVFQTDTMARKKSSSNVWLTLHIITYTIPWLVFGWIFALVNAVLHWGTDYVTSRMSSSLHKQGKTKAFFIVIGLDQAIHLTTLFVTYFWLIGV